MSKIISSSSRLIVHGAVMLGVACLGYFMASRYVTSQIVSAQVQVAPYRADIVGYEFNDPKHPEGIYRFRRIEARSSSSAKVTVEHLPRLGDGNFVRRVDFPDGRFAGIVDFMKMKASGRLSTEEIAARRRFLLNVPSDCRLYRNEVVVGTSAQFNEQVVAVQIRDSEGNRLTHLRAPRLACTDLAWRNERPQPDGTFLLVSEARLIALTTSEPDASLFDPTVTYQERTPSDIQRSFAQAQRIPCEQCAKQWDAQDAYYRAHQ